MTKTLKIAITFSLVMLLGTGLFIASENLVSKDSAGTQSVSQLTDFIVNPAQACCDR